MLYSLHCYSMYSSMSTLRPKRNRKRIKDMALLFIHRYRMKTNEKSRCLSLFADDYRSLFSPRFVWSELSVHPFYHSFIALFSQNTFLVQIRHHSRLGTTMRRPITDHLSTTNPSIPSFRPIWLKLKPNQSDKNEEQYNTRWLLLDFTLVWLDLGFNQRAYT